MADIEQPAVTAGGQMLLDYPGLVLDRHLPAAEVDHFAVMLYMPPPKGRFFKLAVFFHVPNPFLDMRKENGL